MNIREAYNLVEQPELLRDIDINVIEGWMKAYPHYKILPQLLILKMRQENREIADPTLINCAWNSDDRKKLCEAYFYQKKNDSPKFQIEEQDIKISKIDNTGFVPPVVLQQMSAVSDEVLEPQMDSFLDEEIDEEVESIEEEKVDQAPTVTAEVEPVEQPAVEQSADDQEIDLDPVSEAVSQDIEAFKSRDIIADPISGDKQIRPEAMKLVDRDLRIVHQSEEELAEAEMRDSIKKLLENETSNLGAKQEVESTLNQLSALKTEKKFGKVEMKSDEMEQLKSKIRAYSKQKQFSEFENDRQDIAINSELNPIHTQEENLDQIRSFVDTYRPRRDSGDIKDVSTEEMVNKSISSNDIPVSELLAELYVRQGRKEKAIEVYRELGLKFPDKISYFAKKIVNLNNS